MRTATIEGRDVIRGLKDERQEEGASPHHDSTTLRTQSTRHFRRWGGGGTGDGKPG